MLRKSSNLKLVSKGLKALLRGLNSKWISSILVIFIAISVSLASIFIVKARQRVQEVLDEQLLHREQAIVRAGANSIESFIKLSGNSLLTLSKESNFVNDDRESYGRAMDAFVEDWEGTPLVEVIYADSDGTIVHVSNRKDSLLTPGVDVSDRDYFKAFAKEELGVSFFVGKPLLPRLGGFEGEYIIPISAPVYQDGELIGVLGAAIHLGELTDYYVAPLAISEESITYLVDSDGVVLYSPFPQLVATSLAQFFKENHYPGSDIVAEKVVWAVESGEEGKMNVTLLHPDNGELRQFLIAYSPVENIGDEQWLLALGAPQDEIFKFYWPFHGNQIIAFGFFLTVVVGLSAIGILGFRIAQRDGYVDGFASGRDNMYKKFKREKKKKK